MSEDINITFTGTDEVSSVISDISDRIADLESEGEEAEHQDIEITISSDETAPEVEQIMWDLIDKIKTRASEEDAEFLLNL